MIYNMMIFFSKVACNLPKGLRLRIGGFIGWITWCIVPKKRKKMAIRNVRLSLGVEGKKAEFIAKMSWTRFGRMIMEVLIFPKIKKDIDSCVIFKGLENLDKALAEGKGVVLATSHSGNWELLGGALATKGYPLVAVAKKQTAGQMDKFINEFRTLVGMHVTYKTGVIEMVKMLGKGNIIGLLMDQDAGYDGVILDFLNRPASCPKGCAFLARLKDAPIVPAFITENDDDTHTILIKDVMHIEKTDDKEADIKKMTEKLNIIIENHIKEHPTEWFWLHNRWSHTEEILKMENTVL